jgi:hypothetical protein
MQMEVCSLSVYQQRNKWSYCFANGQNELNGLIYGFCLTIF